MQKDELNIAYKAMFPNKGKWTLEQTMLAFYFYSQTPFGKLHARNPSIIAFAHLIGRTPSALAMKCVNFASLDPAHQARGVKGLSNASELDQQVYGAFHADWEGLIQQCGSILQTLSELHPAAVTAGLHIAEVSDQANHDLAGTTSPALVQVRVGQRFFRNSVLSSYQNRCCLSGVSDTTFLVASHIVPWRDDASIRLHPGNGLCLSVLHDRAFDQYLFSLSSDYRVILSAQLENTSDTFLRNVFHPLAHQRICLPTKFLPELGFLQRHREKMQALNENF